MSNPYIDWPGATGDQYRYWYLGANILRPISGNYAFVRHTGDGWCTPLYFGETGSLLERISRTHFKWDAAVALGVTHVLFHPTPAGLVARCSEEQDLIERWQPVLNVQHRSAL